MADTVCLLTYGPWILITDLSLQANGIAGSKMAAIPELVEYILLELPLRDVLLAQRIDRTWRNIIQGSSKLQKALFFRPSVDHTLMMRGLSDYTKTPCHCSKEQREPPLALHLSRSNVAQDQRWARDETDMNDYAVAINPFVTRGNCAYSDIEEGIDEHLDMTGPHASLRRMLFTQPPVEVIIMDTMDTTDIQSCTHLIPRRPGAIRCEHYYCQARSEVSEGIHQGASGGEA